MRIRAIRKRALESVAQDEGILRLKPTLVQRFYRDLNRLGQRAAPIRPPRGSFFSERWIASCTQASPRAAGGLSYIDHAGETFSLRDAIAAAPTEMLGERLATRDREFRVLVKILDPGEAIPLHLHATDGQVRAHRSRFRGHRFGKDEAYYFLDAPKGPMPYTHAGLLDGVSAGDFARALQRGSDAALELSPAFYQNAGSGFFVPAGVPHRPGTALTLEIQQPSDVATMLDENTFKRDLELVELHTSYRVARSEGFALKPRVTRQSRGGEIAWIFPPAICRKFAGKRIRVRTTITYREHSPIALFIWQGRGTVNGRRAQAGDEYFIAESCARKGLDFSCASDNPFEAFALFPV